MRHPDVAAEEALNIIYVDDALLVLDKPSGLLSVPGKGDDKQDCASVRAQARFADALVVHRLDMATSGLMLMARGAVAQRALSQAFANRSIAKRYCAVVDGSLKPTQDQISENGPEHEPEVGPGAWAEINLPIALDWPKRPLRIIDTARGKPSVTRWRIALPRVEGDPRHTIYNAIDMGAAGHPGKLRLKGGAPFTRLELAPVTGRSHQLRVHLAALGHPILGDMLYAPPEVQARASRLLLHATRLALAHPVTGQALQFDSPAPF